MNPTTIRIPLDVDDPDGHGVDWALGHASLDWYSTPSPLIHAVTDAWLQTYRDCTIAAVTAAGYDHTVTGYVTDSDYDRYENMPPRLHDVVSMGDVYEQAQQQFTNWWTDNSARLITEHSPTCVVCHNVLTSDCACRLLAEGRDAMLEELASMMTVSKDPTRGQVRQMADLLKRLDLLARDMQGCYILADIDANQFIELIAVACALYDPHSAWLDALDILCMEEGCTILCSGWQWEDYRDRYEPAIEHLTSMADIDATFELAARTCITDYKAQQ